MTGQQQKLSADLASQGRGFLLYPFGERVVPHTPGAIVSIARQKAGTNFCADILVAPAARSCQPGIKANPRDNRAPPHYHSPVLRNKT
jgi:hypothetical protein